MTDKPPSTVPPTDKLEVFGDLPPEERERSRRRRKEIQSDPELMKELMSQIRDIPWPDGYDPDTQTTLDDWPAEFDVPIFPGSLRTLEELRARYPDPLTGADREEERHWSAKWGHPVRLVRVGVNTIIVTMLTVPAIMRSLERAVAEGQLHTVDRWIAKFGPFIMEHGDDAARDRVSIAKERGYILGPPAPTCAIASSTS